MKVEKITIEERFLLLTLLERERERYQTTAETSTDELATWNADKYINLIDGLLHDIGDVRTMADSKGQPIYTDSAKGLHVYDKITDVVTVYDETDNIILTYPRNKKTKPASKTTAKI